LQNRDERGLDLAASLEDTEPGGGDPEDRNDAQFPVRRLSMDLRTVTPRDEDNGRRNEELAIRQWRAHQLQRLGVSRLLALTFAVRVDWHEVAELVDRGCSPELALEIVR
jgi:hypothetical protein